MVPLLFALATQSKAHEFWLEPQNYQSDAGATINIDIRNGEDFKGLTLSWFDPRIQAAFINDGTLSDYKGLPGDLPGMKVTVGDGLTVVGYASTLSRLTYDSWEKTLSFASHKDFPWFTARHADRGLPQDSVTEGYWRFSKTLISGPEATGADAPMGFETEFVALTNPYANADQMTVRLLYQSEPRADAQVEMWEKSSEGVTRTLHRTDAGGTVTLPVKPGHAYMIDAVVLREPASAEAIEKGVMWESLWANMTFAVPE
ncbi:DUF4198 domain-containing protein [Pseudooceanicola onchidii]|uniref:DUF4198 domain-containing protein n=1 Tax=Pseudooceanicola onchidii TaxID=2562279 RepID=UPI0023EF5140|nr:DUF4198 domain-containing protein [Pseudooceanicola onchidii]